MRQLDLFGRPVKQNDFELTNETNSVVESDTRKEIIETEKLIVSDINDISDSDVKKKSEYAAKPSSTEKKISNTNSTVIKKRGRKSFKETDIEIDLIEIPSDEVLFKKQYYSISVVAEWFKVNASLLRYWENEFDILKPKKNGKGDRFFRPEDVKNLLAIYYLLRQRKFSIEGAKQYLAANKKKLDVNLQLIKSLTKFRAFLLELKANLD